MLTTINMTTDFEDMNRFSDKKELQQFYQKLGIDGIELMLVGGTDIPDKITQTDVLGLHLNFPPYWYAFWKEDREALLEIFDEEKNWIEFYGGNSPSLLVEKLKKELDIAAKLQVKYVVFHVSESDLDECFNYKIKHRDEEICDAAAEIINQAMDSSAYSFEFLCENLWWSGLTMLHPEVTKRLMEHIHYEKKGIMLDTGHLLHTNRKLRSQDEAVAYIHEILDRHGELCHYIRGVHLQQSLTGEYVEDFLKSQQDVPMTYYEKMMMVYPHIFKIDLHQPFTAKGVYELIQRISPSYLTYELITETKEDHLKKLEAQLSAMKDSTMENPS